MEKICFIQVVGFILYLISVLLFLVGFLGAMCLTQNEDASQNTSMFWYGGKEESQDRILFGIGKVASVVDPEGDSYFQTFTWKYWYYDECSTMDGDEVTTPPLHTTHILSPPVLPSHPPASSLHPTHPHPYPHPAKFAMDR
jgi:hypothetical protein